MLDWISADEPSRITDLMSGSPGKLCGYQEEHWEESWLSQNKEEKWAGKGGGGGRLETDRNFQVPHLRLKTEACVSCSS